MTTQIVRFYTAVKLFSLTAWWSGVLERLAVRVVNWAFSHSSVQKAFVEHVSCGTPIGRALNKRIDDAMDEFDREIDADDICGLDRWFENSFEEAMRNFSIHAEQIEELDEAITEQLEVGITVNADDVKGLDDAIGEATEHLIDEKLSKAITSREQFDAKILMAKTFEELAKQLRENSTAKTETGQ